MFTSVRDASAPTRLSAPSDLSVMVQKRQACRLVFFSCPQTGTNRPWPQAICGIIRAEKWLSRREKRRRKTDRGSRTPLNLGTASGQEAVPMLLSSAARICGICGAFRSLRHAAFGLCTAVFCCGGRLRHDFRGCRRDEGGWLRAVHTAVCRVRDIAAAAREQRGSQGKCQKEQSFGSFHRSRSS